MDAGVQGRHDEQHQPNQESESILSGKVLVTCTVTIFGLWSHSGTGEEWADDENGVTSADAQASKRTCSCLV